ncbi:MAG TPA: hypothetical protein VNA57_07540 [Acidimicrobiales bacterium]|nr:hypothetical protein [Acidimicrobiales bacterium]
MVAGVAIAGAAIATAGPAFACVTFKGQITVTGPEARAHTVRGDGTSHGYCPLGHPQDGGPIVLGGVPGQTIRVDIAPAVCSTGTSRLGSTTSVTNWQVALVNGPAYTAGGYTSSAQSFPVNKWGCWSTTPGYSPSQKYTGFPGSAFAIDTLGFGSTTITVPSLPIRNSVLNPSDASVLCVGPAVNPQFASDGIFAPFTVL